VRSIALLLLALPAAGAPLSPAAPRLSLRLEGIFGQPSRLLGARGGGGIGIGYRLTDQLALVADAARMAAPRGGIGSVAIGLQATLDSTPIAPYLELAMVDFTNRNVLGYSLATRTSAGADWQATRAMAIGLVVRTYAAFDPENGNDTLAGIEAAVRLVFTPGAM
jgi:hypothetical protein